MQMQSTNPHDTLILSADLCNAMQCEAFVMIWNDRSCTTHHTSTLRLFTPQPRRTPQLSLVQALPSLPPEIPEIGTATSPQAASFAAIDPLMLGLRKFSRVEMERREDGRSLGPLLHNHKWAGALSP
ncbi:hypothetical protein E2P81_ATG07500 [Venturia nashicola]|uniref:Uncharacterized protein n=1 Tax=Venturia nashicola TaxID=86259 RepID=A0A4Z1NVS7_9PEZI|nr:hypothetical protein E6O75_ATG07657 [Venturia nashicola]TLD32010.1 hypothetical protein E2P81_ATG07500 [Venturia nashicola]